jgi:hypothetical protein
MKFLSFDVGIRNLSYCIGNFDEDTKELTIEEWNIINLIEDELDAQQLCSHVGKTKHHIKCKKFANFMIANGKEYFCKTHKKNYKKYIPPIIKKINVDKKCCEENCNKKVKYEVNMRHICSSHKSQIEKNFKDNFSLKKVKTIKCKDYPIDKLADKMIKILDEKYQHFFQCNIVLIELQPTTNPKMKSISNYLSMYFRIRGKHDKVFNSQMEDILYYRATNKLEFNKSNTDDNKDTYKNRKKTSIENVNDYLDSKNDMENKEKFNTHKKKDDLSDALLQILSYLKKNIYL